MGKEIIKSTCGEFGKTTLGIVQYPPIMKKIGITVTTISVYTGIKQEKNLHINIDKKEAIALRDELNEFIGEQ